MIIGTRDSALALRQTEIFISEIGISSVKIKKIKSSGDLDLSSPLNEMQGYGAFVRELDAALLSKEIDVSVNSMKDMPTTMPEGLCVAAVLKRADPRDVMIPCGLEELPHKATVGTSSIRRAAELKAVRPDVITKQLRGNVQTRLSKLDSGDYDAIILAKAGLDRLSVDKKMNILSPEIFVPAPAQGAIAAVCRSDDVETIKIVSSADDPLTRKLVTVEREIMRVMGAGCSSPVGIHASVSDNAIKVMAVSFDTGRPIRLETTIPNNYDEKDIITLSNILKGDL